MEEQKHTQQELMQFRYKRMATIHQHNMELLERVSSLTKERDEWKSKAIDLVNSIESQSQYKALTEQVEKLKAENEDLKTIVKNLEP